MSEEYQCPKCDEPLKVESHIDQCTCPYCRCVFTIDRDGEFIDGRWINKTRLFIQTI